LKRFPAARAARGDVPCLVSLPDLLILDEPTNHLDPESIDWSQIFSRIPRHVPCRHARPLFSRSRRKTPDRIIGRPFFSHAGNYTDYLLAKVERQAADATIEHKPRCS